MKSKTAPTKTIVPKPIAPTSPIMAAAQARVQAAKAKKAPTTSQIRDKQLAIKWRALSKYLTTTPEAYQSKKYLNVNKQFYMLRKDNKFRLISRLDWVFYEYKDLANAIDTDTVEDYYYQQLSDLRSPDNIWKDTTEELDLKTYYANRVGRNIDKLDNL